MEEMAMVMAVEKVVNLMQTTSILDCEVIGQSLSVPQSVVMQAWQRCRSSHKVTRAIPC